MAATTTLVDHISSSTSKEEEKKITSESKLKEKSNDTTTKSSLSSSYLFLRVKRKRHEDPLEQLIIQTTSSDSKKQKSSSSGTRKSSGGLIDQFNRLSTKEQQQQQQQQQALVKPHHVVFQRIDTIDQKKTSSIKGTAEEEEEKKLVQRLKSKMKMLKQQQQKQRTSNKSQVQEDYTQRRMIDQQGRAKEQRLHGIQKIRKKALSDRNVSIKEEKTVELGAGIRLVDLYTTNSNIGDGSTDAVTSSASIRRVLNPSERELDEAIWRAFRENDFSFFFRIFSSSTSHSMLKTPAAQFQRPADGSTILMAAAAHNRADVIEILLRQNAANVLQQDWHGQTANCFARNAGHTSIEKALLACEEVEREKEFVYDVYCVDMDASRQHQQQQEFMEQDEETTQSSAPIVSVSSAVQRWLSQDHSMMDGKNSDEAEVEEYMLESDLDSNEEIDGESIDSNDEAYEFNDYPDEEDDDENEEEDPWSTENSEDEGMQRMKAWHSPSNTNTTMTDVYDY